MSLLKPNILILKVPPPKSLACDDTLCLELMYDSLLLYLRIDDILDHTHHEY